MRWERDSMADSISYILLALHAEFDASAAADCSHATPTKICPFCLKCFCNASEDYKKKYMKNCPKELLAEYVETKDVPVPEDRRDPGQSRAKFPAGQLDKALDKQRIVNKKLGEVLIMMSLVTPDELQLYLLNQKNVETDRSEEFLAR